jgi:hypothetical protein
LTETAKRWEAEKLGGEEALGGWEEDIGARHRLTEQKQL